MGCKRITWCLSLALVCSLLCCETLLAVTTAPYFPIEEGNSWTYNNNNDGIYTTTVLTGTVLVNGAATTVLKESVDGVRSYITNDENGIRLHRQFSPSLWVDGLGYVQFDVIYSPPMKMVDAETSIGAIISSNGTATTTISGLGTFDLTYSLTSSIKGMEEVTVPAGTYQAVKITQDITVAGYVQGTYSSDTSNNTTWLVKNVGEVKFLGLDSDGLEEEVLIATNVAPKVTPIAGANGTITPGTPQYVPYNETITFTVTPETSYLIDSVTGCGGTLTGNSYTTAPISEDCEVMASFFPSQNASIGAALVNHNWSPKTIPGGFSSPVIIVGPPTRHGADPGVVRLRDVTSSGFDVRYQEWDYLDGGHAAKEDISYLVFESGHSTDGTLEREVGTFDLSGTGSFATVNFNESFIGVPAVFLTVQTVNGGSAVTVRAKDVSKAGFKAALYEQESLMDGHASEVVGYLAIYTPTGSGTFSINGTDYPFVQQQVQVDEKFVPVLSHTIKVEEEKSADDETAHLDETIDVLVVGKHLFAQDVSSKGADPCSLRRMAPEYGAWVEWGTVTNVTDNWLKLPLAKSYTNPVVVVRPVSYNGTDAGVIRTRNVTNNSFEIKYQEWAYLDGKHIKPEQVFYLVANAGKSNVGGLTLYADTLKSNKLLNAGDWEDVVYPDPYSFAPAVFTSVTTYKGGDPVTTRVRGVDNSGFSVTMQEDQSKNDGHVTETIGWISIATGSGTTSDKRKVKVMDAQTNDAFSVTNFGQTFARRYPVMVGDMTTSFGTDPCVLRYKDLTNSKVELKVQEEQSADNETSHALEDLSIFLAE